MKSAFSKAVAFCLLAGLAAAALGAESLPAVAELKPNPDLPDPLVMLNGKRVTSKRQWERERRPELKRLFQHYMYGYMPAPPERVTATVEREDSRFFNGKATKR